jgi:hypothetical protein
MAVVVHSMHKLKKDSFRVASGLVVPILSVDALGGNSRNGGEFQTVGQTSPLGQYPNQAVVFRFLFHWHKTTGQTFNQPDIFDSR